MWEKKNFVGNRSISTTNDFKNLLKWWKTTQTMQQEQMDANQK